MSLLPNALHIAGREYRQRAGTRLFMLMTVGLALIAFLIAIAPAAARALGPSEPSRIGVVALDAVSADEVAATLRSVFATPGASPDPGLADGANASRFEIVTFDDAAAAERELADGELAGLLAVSRDDGDLAFRYRTDAGAFAQAPLLVQQAATAMTINDRLAREGLAPEQRADLFAPPDFRIERPDADAATTPAQEADEFWPNYALATALVVLVFMAIVIYGNWVAASVAEEKSSRVMELLVTAATPNQLLVGKVLGTGAVGLTQYAAILIAAGLGLALHGPIESLLVTGEPGPGIALQLSLPLLLIYGAFFMAGFLLYATLYAAVGSMVSRQEDINQVAGPMITLAMAGYFASFFALNNIDAGWVTPLSHVPFFSPYLMTARMILSTVPAWELALSLAILVASVVVAMLLASRIYSAGVLLYGQRRGLREVLRAARVSR